MGRAQSKKELLESAQIRFEKLWRLIDGMTPRQLETAFDFSGDVKKKEAHWRRDKNLRDVLIHLYEWHQLLLNWVHANASGESQPFLPAPYNWKTYGDMNVAFWEKHQKTSLDDAKKLLKASHDEVVALIEGFDDETLFTKGALSWTGTTTLGSYCVSATASHYDWAMKKLRAHIKRLVG